MRVLKTIDAAAFNEQHAANIIISYLINNNYLQLQPANDARENLFKKFLPSWKSLYSGLVLGRIRPQSSHGELPDA